MRSNESCGGRLFQRLVKQSLCKLNHLNRMWANTGEVGQYNYRVLTIGLQHNGMAKAAGSAGLLQPLAAVLVLLGPTQAAVVAVNRLHLGSAAVTRFKLKSNKARGIEYGGVKSTGRGERSKVPITGGAAIAITPGHQR